MIKSQEMSDEDIKLVLAFLDEIISTLPRKCQDQLGRTKDNCSVGILIEHRICKSRRRRCNISVVVYHQPYDSKHHVYNAGDIVIRMWAHDRKRCAFSNEEFHYNIGNPDSIELVSTKVIELLDDIEELESPDIDSK